MEWDNSISIRVSNVADDDTYFYGDWASYRSLNY